MKTSKKSSRKRQLDLFSNKSIYASFKQLGGSKLKSHPKRKRPISTKDEMHLVMKSAMARKEFSMRSPKHIQKIKKHVYDIAGKFQIRISRYENMGNHLHILLKTPSHNSYVAFVRGVSSAVARDVLGVAKGRPGKGPLFWEARPFTRIVTWGRDRLGLLRYLGQNRIEAVGFQVFVKENELGYLLTG